MTVRAFTPSQTIGPLYGFALMFDGCADFEPEPGVPRISLQGSVLDGMNQALVYPHGMIEIWAGDSFARTRLDGDGIFHATVAKPEASRSPDGTVLAPHLNLALFASGLLKQVQTRMYFPGDPRNESDPVLSLVGASRRDLLIAKASQDGPLVFDIHLQGPLETPCFTF
jgi:protocatechuate 3,4-dioxygenase, alpha subunit